MLKTNLKTIIVSGIALVTLTISCNKKELVQEIDCGFSSEPGTVHFLSIKDSAGRDLLDPKTPGFYPNDKLMELNKDLIPRRYYKEPNEVYRLNLFFSEGESTVYFKLSDTDTDTLYTKYEVVPHKCYPKFLLKSFKYNGKELADSVRHRYFTIIK